MKSFTQLITEVQTLNQSSANSIRSDINSKAEELHSKLKDAGVRVHNKIAKTKSQYSPAFVHVHKDDVEKAKTVLGQGKQHDEDQSDHFYTDKSTVFFTPKVKGDKSWEHGHHIIGINKNWKRSS